MPRRNQTLAGFLALGLFWGAWAAVLPDVQEATNTTKGALGIAMLFVSVGSIPSMPSELDAASSCQSFE